MKSGQFRRKTLKERYVFGVFDKESHKQVYTVKFSIFHLLLVVLGFLTLIIAGIVLLFIYTPLKEFIPGYPNAQTREIMMKNALRADSLEKVVHLWEIHLTNLQKVLVDEDPVAPGDILPQNHLADIPEITVGARSQEDSFCADCS